MTTYAGSVMNPEEYGKQMVYRLCPNTLPYELGTAAAFDLARFNGRPLGDDVQDVMLTLASNTPLQGGADEFTDLPGIYSLTPATFRNLNDHDGGAMVRHPSVLPSSKAHQNMGTRCGYDCDQGQRRPGGACLTPM